MATTTTAARVEILSALPERYRTDLENLMFFNTGQDRARAEILESVSRHGVPEIVAEGQQLSVRVGAFGSVQTLYAIAEVDGRDELAGVVLFHRPTRDQLLILHMAVSERFAGTGEHADTMLVMRLFQSVRGAARRLRGVRAVTLYSHGAARDLPA